MVFQHKSLIVFFEALPVLLYVAISAALIPETFLIFDIGEQCIRKPCVDESPLTYSSSTASTILVEDQDEDDDDDHLLLSFDEQEALSKGKKRVEKALCAERRSVLRHIMNVK